MRWSAARRRRTTVAPARLLLHVGKRAEAELLLRAQQLLQPRPAVPCDVLAQRFCAVEQRALGQHDLARGLELVQKPRQGLTSLGVLDKAGKALAQEHKVLAAHERVRRGR